MKISIDTDETRMIVEDGLDRHELPLYSASAFSHLSRLWVKVGWARKYSYGFTWMGRPIIQLPEDLVRIQETIYRVQPDVLVETGVAHGGSLIFYASLFKAMGKGHVVGVDIEIRPHNRAAIEAHALSNFITLIEGSSIAPQTLDQVKALISATDRVMVVLDSNHSRPHVLEELRLYSPLVSEGSYIVATDGIMEDVFDVPSGKPDWRSSNPSEAAREFAASNATFSIEAPPFAFNETMDSVQTTYWPDAYLRRVERPTSSS